MEARYAHPDSAPSRLRTRECMPARLPDHRQLREVSTILLLGVEAVLAGDIGARGDVDLDGAAQDLDAVAHQCARRCFGGREVNEGSAVELTSRLVSHPVNASNLTKLIEALNNEEQRRTHNAIHERQRRNSRPPRCLALHCAALCCTALFASPSTVGVRV